MIIFRQWEAVILLVFIILPIMLNAQKIKSIEIFAVPLNTRSTPCAEYVDYFFMFLWNKSCPMSHIILKRKENLPLFRMVEKEIPLLREKSMVADTRHLDITMCVHVGYRKNCFGKKRSEWLSFEVNQEIAKGQYSSIRYKWNGHLFRLLSGQIDSRFFPLEKIMD